MEKEAFEKLYETYYMRVYSYAMTLAKRQHIAEELTQEAFYRAFTSKSGFRGESNPLTWLCAIAKNLFLDEMRRQSKSVDAEADINVSDGVDIQRQVEDHDASYRIHLALNELEEPYRRVFELRIFGELSFREIGGICARTENWARVTYHRAKLKLQERVNYNENEL